MSRLTLGAPRAQAVVAHRLLGAMAAPRSLLATAAGALRATATTNAPRLASRRLIASTAAPLQTDESQATGVGDISMRPPRLAFVSGSSRAGSLNTKLAQAAAAVAEDMHRGTEITVVDPRAFELPVYSQDLEAAGMPEAVKELKGIFQATDAFVFACPEYNGSVTPYWKNMVDWCSRPHEDDEPMYSAFKGKAAGLVSTSPGALGGLRGLFHYRDVLGYVGVHVVAEQLAVGGGFKAFDEHGALISKSHAAMLQATVGSVWDMAAGFANKNAMCSVAEMQRRMRGQVFGEYGHIDLEALRQ